ncbi:MAG TPA: hypothetical protein VKE41_09010 [Roseiflexaceae bacterium]|nr:hypothetical protein [Roseiflexaceae bacterium]
MTSLPSTRDLIQMAQAAGYQIVTTQQLRANRWLLTLSDSTGATTLALIQARPLISAADVQDLAELARLRRPAYAVLLAYGGTFSPAAQRTLAELGDDQLRLCTSLPPAAQSDPEGPRNANPALRPIR